MREKEKEKEKCCGENYESASGAAEPISKGDLAQRRRSGLE